MDNPRLGFFDEKQNWKTFLGGTIAGVGFLATAYLIADGQYFDSAAAAYYYLTPEHQSEIKKYKEVDFGPRHIISEAVLKELNQMYAGPQRPFEFLGARPCPIPGYRLRAGRTLILDKNDQMYAHTQVDPFVIEKGAKFRVRKKAILSITNKCN